MWNGEIETAPCHQSKEVYLLEENNLIWEIWSICHKMSRQKDFMSGYESHIRLNDVIKLCEIKDVTEDDLNYILLIENKIYPSYIEKISQQQKIKR